MLISEVEKGLPFLPLGTSEIGKLNQKQAHIRLRAAVLPVGVREPLTSSCFRKGQRLPVGEEGLLCVGHRWSEAEERIGMHFGVLCPGLGGVFQGGCPGKWTPEAKPSTIH